MSQPVNIRLTVPSKPDGYHLRQATDHTPSEKRIECPCCSAELVLAPGRQTRSSSEFVQPDWEDYMMHGGSPVSLSATMAMEDLQYIDVTTTEQQS